jgi:GH25 family lysozyme M1 (1,4-beta-N-acetylmuramidase)
LPASRDNSPDPDAAWNHDQIADNGLVRGAYHFLHPSLSGKAQAEYFVSVHDQLGFDRFDMLHLDNEATDGLSPAAVAACAQDFMAELKVLKPNNPRGVYSNLSFAFGGYDAGLGGYDWWAAHPGSAPVPPPQWSRWTFWQWGLRTGVDADAFNGTVSQFDAWLNSFLPPPPPPPGPPFRHVLTKDESIASIAAGRNEKVSSLLTHQAAAFTAADAAATVLRAGSVYYTENP